MIWPTSPKVTDFKWTFIIQCLKLFHGTEVFSGFQCVGIYCNGAPDGLGYLSSLLFLQGIIILGQDLPGFRSHEAIGRILSTTSQLAHLGPGNKLKVGVPENQMYKTACEIQYLVTSTMQLFSSTHAIKSLTCLCHRSPFPSWSYCMRPL